MEEIAKKLGEIAVGAIVKAIKERKSRAEAAEAAAAAIRRSDIVSDELWDQLEEYVDQTRDFEDHGAGG